MKSFFLTICTALLLSILFGQSNSDAAEPTHHVGLHDRLLEFTAVQLINGDMKVPLSEISNYLYIPVEKENGITYLRKYGITISYNHATKLTLKDSVAVDWLPIIEQSGTLFISVKYIASELGFQIEYFQNLQSLRIYRDDYAHMSHKDFEKHLQRLLNKSTVTPPTPKSTNEKSKANVYLTFDDGPNKFTTINNNTMKKYNVKGTFFFLGNNMMKNQAIVDAVSTDGHYIGTHSMTHDKNKVYKSPQAFIHEMNEGTKLILQMTGHDAKLLRVPYGSKPHVTQGMKNQLNKFGYKLWDWDVDSNDWRYTDKQADQIVQNVRKGVEKSYKSGDRDIIILLHDRSQTAKALPDIIKWLQDEGYSLKTYESDNHIVQNFSNDITL